MKKSMISFKINKKKKDKLLGFIVQIALPIGMILFMLLVLVVARYEKAEKALKKGKAYIEKRSKIWTR